VKVEVKVDPDANGNPEVEVIPETELEDNLLELISGTGAIGLILRYGVKHPTRPITPPEDGIEHF